MLDLSVGPFYDDFQTSAKGKNYQKILFVPGNAVQARELNQIQSIIQEQIKRNGDAVFANGTVIQPGNIFYDNSVVSLKLNSTYLGASADAVGASLIGTDLTGLTTNIVAHVIHFEPSTATDPSTIFIKYKTSGGSTYTGFVASEVLSSAIASIQIQSAGTPINAGSVASIGDGIYYVNGYFVGVSAQTIALDKYDSTPSMVVGLNVVENVVTASQDPTLYDNAQGTSNFTAPGASRYQIQLILATRNFDFSVQTGQAAINFIPLLKLNSGQIQYKVDNTQYSKIADMIARRTYDEAGDFIVEPYTLKPFNYRSNQRGQWVAGTPYLAGDYVTNANVIYTALNSGYAGVTAPTVTYGTQSDGVIVWQQKNTSFNNQGLYQSTSTDIADHTSDDGLFVVSLSAGKSYIKGYEVKTYPVNVFAPKTRSQTTPKTIHLQAPLGLRMQVSNLVGAPNLNTMTAVNLLSAAGAIIGTAYAASIEYVSGTPGTTAAAYNLYLIDVLMQSGYDFVDDASVISCASFSANIVATTSQLTGAVNTTAASANVIGVGTTFTQDLKPHDNIQINNVNVVVLSIQSDTQLTLTANFATTLSAVPIFSLENVISGSGYNFQVFPNSFISSTRNANGLVDISYAIKSSVSFTTSSTSYTWNLGNGGDVFAGLTGIIVANAAASGAIINATYALDSTNTQLTISGLAASTSYVAIATVTRSATSAKQKTKTPITFTIIATDTNITDANGNILSTSWNRTSNVISLMKADAFMIAKVTMSGAAGSYNSVGETDVTMWYGLQTNVTPSFYDVSTITRMPNIAPPANPIKITFEYFAHSTGDYFTVDSYSAIPYNQIPVHTFNGIDFNMRDCIDFRARAADGGGFSGTNVNIPSPFVTGTQISTSYSYYQSRNDVIGLKADGTFEYSVGVEADQPTDSVNTDGVMTIASLSLTPYIFSPGEINIKSSSHKRYTMKDIGDIDSRLSDVEYYVALNQLEKNAATMNVYDSNGLPRYKSGFIADPFNDYSVADTNSPDFSSIISGGNLLPYSESSNTPLIEPTSITDAARTSAGYQITGDWVSLPYTEQPLITQNIATHSEYINPFTVFRFDGSLKLTPSSDTGMDVKNISISVTN